MKLKLFCWVSIRGIMIKNLWSWALSLKLSASLWRLKLKRIMTIRKDVTSHNLIYDGHFLFKVCCSYNDISILKLATQNKLNLDCSEGGGGKAKMTTNWRFLDDIISERSLTRKRTEDVSPVHFLKRYTDNLMGILHRFLVFWLL